MYSVATNRQSILNKAVVMNEFNHISREKDAFHFMTHTKMATNRISLFAMGNQFSVIFVPFVCVCVKIIVNKSF